MSKRPSTLLLALSIPALLLCACRSADQPATSAYMGKTSQRVRLEDFVAQLATAIEVSGDRVADATDEPEKARTALLWKMRVIPAARRCLELADDQAAFLKLWLYCARLQHASRSEAVTELFGVGAPFIRDTCFHLEQEALQIAPTFLNPKQIEVATESIAAAYKDDDTLGIFGNPEQTSPETADPVASVIGDVINKPIHFVLRPLGSMNPASGLSDTALAVERAAISVDSIRTDIGYLPDMIRWQTALLMHELERNQAVASTVASMEDVGKSSERIAAVAETLPKELRKELSDFVAEVDRSQTNLHATLDKTRESVTEVNIAIDKVDGLMQSSDTTAQSLAFAGKVLEDLVREVTHLIETAQGPQEEADSVEVAAALDPDREPKPPGKPFDISEYTEAAKKLTESAQALNTLVEDVTELIQPETSKKGTQAVVSLVDALLYRAGFALTFVVSLALGGRWAWRRLAPRDG